MTGQRFSVEFDQHVVGIAVRVPGGFVFYSSDRRFGDLDGKTFPRAKSINQKLEVLARNGRTIRKFSPRRLKGFGK